MNWHLLFILSLVHTSYQCGVTTHNVIANTALEWLEHPYYKELITNNIESFQAGAAFPDWGYDCILNKYVPNLPDGSELAHWLPFQKELINYIRETGSHELTAFLFGVVSHSVADVIWHDIYYIHPSRQGFITALGNSNCKPHCNYDPHTIADVGGEFVAAYQTDLSFIREMWKLPTTAIVNVYKKMGYAFEWNETVLDVCVAELFTEVQAISKLPSELLLAYYDKVAPFLFEEYQDWWLGGVDSNALWTVYCWNSTIRWLEHGIPAGDPLYCYPLTGKVNTTLHILREIQSRKALRSALRVSGPTRLQAPGILRRVQLVFQNSSSRKLVPQGLGKNSRFGHSIITCDLTGNGNLDIIIGAPNANSQRGAVYIYYNSTNSVQLDYPNSPGDRFGYSLQCLDLNKDGRNDIIVGSPGFGNYPNMDYNGAIHIFYNTGIHKFVGKKYFNYGNTLDKGDLDGDGYDDLIIGVPNGRGPPYTKVHNFENGELWYMLAGSERPKKLYSSDDFWSWFGYKSRVIIYNNQTFLLTSAPNYNNGTDAVGKLVCFNNAGDIVWEIVGDMVNSKFGMSFDVYDQILVVSAPTSTVDLINQGIVYSLPLDRLFKGDQVRLADFVRYTGGTYYSRLGWNIQWNNGLLLSEPYYDGRGRVQYGTRQFVGEKHSQFGYASVVSNKLLIVGSPREHGRGAINIYHL